MGPLASTAAPLRPGLTLFGSVLTHEWLDVGYMVFEFPAFILIRRYHAPTVYALAVIVFGIAGLCTAYAKNYAQVLVLRLILGCGEATVQTSFLFVSLWYRREELSTRCGKLQLCS